MVKVASVAVLLDAREVEFVPAFGYELRLGRSVRSLAEGIEADAADVLGLFFAFGSCRGNLTADVRKAGDHNKTTGANWPAARNWRLSHLWHPLSVL